MAFMFTFVHFLRCDVSMVSLKFKSFQANVPFLYSLKTSANQTFAEVQGVWRRAIGLEGVN